MNGQQPQPGLADSKPGSAAPASGDSQVCAAKTKTLSNAAASTPLQALTTNTTQQQQTIASNTTKQQQQTANTITDSRQTSSSALASVSSNNQQQNADIKKTDNNNKDSSSNNIKTTTTSDNHSDITSSTSGNDNTAGEQESNSGSASSSGAEQVKQFSDKSLHQLADYYLNLPPADIPDTGFVVAGIAGRFPNADNMNELWDNLLNGHDMVRGPDDKRWPLGLWDLPKKAARIKDISRFDNEFFGFTKETADYTDHQLRNLYEVIYESMLDAGINPASMRGDKRTGIFFGFHTTEVENEYFEKPQFRTTGYQSQLLTAVSDYFDIRGVVGSYDAACASSFAAFHQAVVNLRAGLIDTAIVCGVNISVRPGTSYQFLLLQMLSPTGSSKFLDASADGYAKTEACVSVILTREDLARRSYAAIVHTKCNNDGFKVEGITFPSSNVQEALMQGAIVESGVDPNQIVYVEAHGTGTPAGDPEEARAIAKVYCGEDRSEPLLIGSVKSNMGHAEGVSGLCSLAKVICTFENELLPRNLHYKTPNPNIQPLVEGRLKPVDQNVPFKHNLIPMNCYGFGGVNVHGIFKTVTKKVPTSIAYDIAPEFPRLITMFGRSQQALEFAFAELKKNGLESIVKEEGSDNEVVVENKRILTRDYLALLDSINDGSIDRLMNYRGFLLVDNELNEIDSGIAQLELPGPTKRDELMAIFLKDDKIMYNKMTEDLTKAERPNRHYQDMDRQTWFVLPGLGSQWRAMGKNLTTFKPVWETIESLAGVLKPLGVDLIDIIINDEVDFFASPQSNVNLFTSIVAIQIALIDLLKRLNVKPDGIVGHSIGEISCAYADGLLNASETIQLAYYLAKPIDDAQLHNGAMLAVSLSAKQANEQIETFKRTVLNGKKECSVSVACINGDESVTLAGVKEEIEQISNMLTDDNVYARRVPDVRTPFHTNILRKVEKQMLESVQQLFNNNNIQSEQYKAKKWHSTLLENRDNKFEINAQYFVDNLCSPVLFKQVTDSIEPTTSIIIEVGPHRLFQPILKQKYLTKLNYVTLMKRADGSVNSLLSSLGQLYQLGKPLRISNLYPKVEYPVGKGTASISSIVRWNHNTEFHVAKYPEAFRKPPCEARVKFDLIDESDKYLAGHCIDGRILFPATGYLYLVWRSFSLIRDKVGNSALLTKQAESQLIPVEFTNVRLYRATILGSAPVEILVRLEEATGQFEVREGGSVVADGYIASPKVNPEGLQYEHLKELAKKKEAPLTLSTDDVYKQFRVNGYDYGESFRNIVAASADGLHIQVKWAGQFIPFSDSVLQSLFLAICKRTSALFLPTKFEYMRINPLLLQAKVDAAQAKNEPCILEAYCELETGIIVTDGIEMRGVGASPAPRRLQQEPLMESYQFVPNIERQINDKLAEPTITNVEQYKKMCTTAAVKILSNLNQSAAQISSVFGSDDLENDETLIKYLDENDSSKHHVLLSALDKILASQEQPEEKEVARGGLEEEEQQPADDQDENAPKAADDENKPAAVKQEGPQRKRVVNPVLRPVEELQKSFEKVVRAEFEEVADKLGGDLLSSAFWTERFLRPLLEIILENTNSQTVKMLELNTGNAIKHEAVATLIGEVAPNVTLNYFLGHVNSAGLPNGVVPQEAKLYKWSPAQKTLARELQDVDFILYNDSNCYPTKKGQFDTTEVARDENGQEIEGAAQTQLYENHESVFTTVSDSLRTNGFFLAMLRTELTHAEKFLYKLTGYEIKQTAERVKMIHEAAEKFPDMRFVAEKSDLNGTTMLLFRKIDEELKMSDVRAVKVEHGKSEKWLELMKKLVEDGKNQENNIRSIWLVATDSSINGAMGMVNCMRREPGGEKIRLLLDQRAEKSPFTYKTKSIDFERTIRAQKEGEEDTKEPVTSENLIDLLELEEEVKASNGKHPLLELVKTDMSYNCFDINGAYGSFRHFTIGDLLNSLKTSTDEAYVNVATRGDLSSFKWYQAPYKYIPDDVRNERLISIYFSALNFRDIMLASGRLPLDALPVSVALSDCILGLEFSGRAPDGRRIAGMLGGRGIGTSAVVYGDSSISFNIPDHISLEEAATVPVVYATVVMALIHRGRMQKGETILVHSGSGGVGQAAIRICLHYGLTVYTTTGNQEKRDFLKQEFPQLTDAHIFNSRDCSFETDLLRATNGRGVDLILNSLSEDKLQASVRCLADGGRFLEIGKYDMALNNPVELMMLDTNKTFHGILLDKLFDTETLTDTYRKQTIELTKLIEKGLFEGWILPIKRTIFEKNQIEDAFRFMASGKHIGKVLIKIRDEEVFEEDFDQKENRQKYREVTPQSLYMEAIPRTMFNPNLSYIITGGLGGFGMEMSKWMTANGAKNIVLTSRTGIKTGYQQLVVDRLTMAGVKVLVSTTDNTTDEGAEKLINEAQSLAPLGGIFNLAMVLKDSLLENTTVDDFRTVCAPKCNGVEALDRVTRRLIPNLELFITFSSVSCGKGNPGQTNYGYANSCMERICELRRLDGFHGLSIQWGAIGDVGVAFENLGGNEAVIGGTIPQRLPSCFATLSRFITSPFATCLSILQADKRSFSAGKKGDLVKTILHVLGIKDPSTVDPNCTLGELGLDSLMAVEIRQALEREYDIVLTVQEIRALTINRIREIGEGEGKSKPADSDAGGNAALQSGTDELGLTAAQQANIYQTETNETLTAIVPGVSISTSATGQRVFNIDRNVAAKAPISLPKEDLILLNGDTNVSLSGNPIFFLPPIQGDFRRLAILAKKLTRPCIGINWTEKMAHFDDTKAAAKAHIDVIRKYYPQLKVLDLVGYSFGSAIAFEIAAYTKKNASKISPPLALGKLVLLDGSPAQINIGVRYITKRLENQDESSRAAEIMAVFLMQHSRFDYLSLKKQILLHSTDEQKLKFTSDLLAKSLGIKDPEQIKDLSDAEEAFCRRFQMMLSYKPEDNFKLDNDCTLIRATEIYVSGEEHTVEEDYGLSNMVSGRVNSCLIKGNHESFIDDNVDQVSTLLQDIICPVLE